MKSERFLIDTNIFILLFKDRLAENLPRGTISCSVITEIELLSFLKLTSGEEAMIRNCLAALILYGIEDDIKEEAIRLRRTHRLKLPDAIIAATAAVHDLILVTNDEALQNITGVRSRKLAEK